MKDRKHEPAARSNNARDAAQRALQICDIHQCHAAHHAVKRSICDALKRLCVSLDVLDPTCLCFFMTASNLQQLRREIHTHNVSSQVGEIPGNSPLTTGEL